MNIFLLDLKPKRREEGIHRGLLQALLNVSVKKHRWFRLLRNGLFSYNLYKVYMKKKISLLLRKGHGAIFR